MQKKLRIGALAGALALAGVMTACTTGPLSQLTTPRHQVTLSGANQVPPVSTSATGTGTVTVNPDRTVSAIITVTGMVATAAHIHEGAAGTNGPVIVPFKKTSDNTFAAPTDAKLTESQYESYKAGNLYVNVHSAKYPGGEIRAQLRP